MASIGKKLWKKAKKTVKKATKPVTDLVRGVTHLTDIERLTKAIKGEK